MASLRKRTRADGSEYFAVLYRLAGKQTSTSFHDFATAKSFCDIASKFGPANALEVLATEQAQSAGGMTVQAWIERYLDHLTGVDRDTVAKYRAYLRNDIAPALGDLPLTAVTYEHVARWLKELETPDEKGRVPAAKTIRNKHGLLSAALGAAVPRYLDANPCARVRLPRNERREPIALTRSQFATLLASVTEYWRPMVKFLLASGARWGEVAALKPTDVDREAGMVHIRRAWRHGEGGYRIGPTKTSKSRRVINVDPEILDQLDCGHEWLFVNRAGGPVRSHGFIARVWNPAVERSGLEPKPIIHDLRHTCGSWLVLGNTPLPVVQDHLGHESIQTTVSIYTHVDRTSMKAAAGIMGDLLK